MERETGLSLPKEPNAYVASPLELATHSINSRLSNQNQHRGKEKLYSLPRPGEGKPGKRL